MRSRKWTQTEFRFKLRPLNLWLAISFAVLISFPFESFAGPVQEHMMRLPSLRQRVEAAEAEIHHLLEQKRHASDPKELKAVIDALAESHIALVKAAKDYDELLMHVRFKHPEQSAEIERQYVRFKVKSLEQMAGEVGLDGRLDRIKARVAATFPAAQGEEKEKPQPKIHPFFRKPASVDSETSDAEHITLSK